MRRQRPDPASDSPGDRLAARALDAAALGVTLLPVAASLYSVGLLLRRRLAGLPITAGGAAHEREAWWLNALILGGAAAAIGLLVAILAWR
jgi:hypothetical protein